jgi:glucokinase
MAKRCVIGVDLGGTNVRAAAVYEDGTFAGERVENPSRGDSGAEATIEAVGRTILQAVAASEAKPEAAGVAIPGTVNDDSGVVRWSPNLGETVDGVFHYWLDVPFRAMLARHADLKALLGNDANLAALGEYRFGTGRNEANCLVMFTLGTGIGNGVILSPKAVQGDARGPLMLLGGNKGGAEMGHSVILHGGLDSTAGAYGAIEGYCQRDAIVKRAVYQLLRGRQSVVRDLVEGELGNVTPRILSEAAAKGDELAIEVWDEIGTYLGVGIGNAINIFAPDVVAIGGQISKAGEFLLGPARKSARKVAIPALFGDADIVQAEQIEDAGILGGAALALQASGAVSK